MAHAAKRPPRPFNDVWLEISEKAREHQRTKRPIVTLKRGVKNMITGVTATEIERMSERPQNRDNPANPSKDDIELIWRVLVSKGKAYPVNLSRGVLYFSWALVHTFLRGLRFVPSPFGLEIADWNLLMTPYADRRRQEEDHAKRAKEGRKYQAGRGGGESDEHKALKQAVFDDPEKHLGEPMTPIKIEYPFVTGDELDVLLRDRQGRFVCVEVEVDIGPGDDIGFHQAGKYRVLTAMENGLRLDEVRAVVVARTIAPSLVHKYQKYSIESHVCGIPKLERGSQPSRNGTTCPKCKSKETVPIEYGYVTPEMLKREREGRLDVRLGGCLPDDSKTWHCKGCDHEWSASSLKGATKPA